MIYVGIDLHATNMVIVAINGNGEVVNEAKIQSSPKALEGFFSQISQPVKALVEYTCFWFWLFDWFRGRDIPLVLAHAKMVNLEWHNGSRNGWHSILRNGWHNDYRNSHSGN